MRPYAWLLLVVACWSTPAAASQPASGQVDDLLVRLERALEARTPIDTLFASGSDPAQIESLALESGEQTTRAVVRERDRQEMPDGRTTRLIADILVETAGFARVSTWRLDVVAGAAEAAEEVDGLGSASEVLATAIGGARFEAAARIALVDGLVRLTLSERPYAVRNLHIRGEDLDVTFQTGTAYVAEVHGMLTAMVVIGDGEARFSPPHESERGQVRLYAGDDVLRSRVSRMFLRVNPADAPNRITLDALQPGAGNRSTLERARRLFAEQTSQSYSLDLNDLSRDTWNLVPPIGDLLVDLDMARYGMLTYARSGNEPEDISLFDRRRRKNVSIYTSQANLAQRGARRYSEEASADYRVEHYNIDVSFDPGRLWIEGRADLDIRITAPAARSISLRLHEALVPRAVTSDEFGRLLALRVRGQNTVVVNLPDALREGDRLKLRVSYGGRLVPQRPEREAIAVEGENGQPPEVEFLVVEPEARFVYSNRSYWYPQSGVLSYATARMRITVPESLTVIASGEAEPPEPATTGAPGRRLFTFNARQPVRYLSFVASRLVQVATRDALEVWSQPRQQGRARDLLPRVSSILDFYAGLVEDVPYPSFRLAVVEDTLPGGHSPAYFAVLHQPVPGSPFTWARDPVAFEDFPDFFLAHELAHQYWGQAVSGESYHDQWISEGLAQYFALLYAQRSRPADAAEGVMRQMQRSALQAAGQGPIWLGYRLGHLKGEGRIFRSTVYNKSALVLHMLRRLLGDDVFERGLQLFYAQSRYRRVGTDDFRTVLEVESGRSLERFFDRWVYEAGIPTIRTAWEALEPVPAGADGHAPALGSARIWLEQVGDAIYDVPVTVTLVYADGRTMRTQVVADDRMTEAVLPLAGVLRDVRFNDDAGALARFERARR